MSVPTSTTEPLESRHGRASSESSTVTTEDTEEENGPHTPFAQSPISPAVTVTGPASEVQNPFSARTKYAGLGVESRLPEVGSKNKALPATPQPRISLDFATSEAEFGDFASGLLSLSTGPGKRVPSSEMMPPPSAPASTQNKPAISGKEIIKAHEEAILARRRALRREEDGDDTSQERPQRRRSQSTGDALDFRTEVRSHFLPSCVRSSS